MKKQLIITGWPFAVCSIHATLSDNFLVGEEVKLISPKHKAWSHKTVLALTPQGAQVVLVELM